MYVCVRTVAQRRLRPKHDDVDLDFFRFLSGFVFFFFLNLIVTQEEM